MVENPSLSALSAEQRMQATQASLAIRRTRLAALLVSPPPAQGAAGSSKSYEGVLLWGLAAALVLLSPIRRTIALVLAALPLLGQLRSLVGPLLNMMQRSWAPRSTTPPTTPAPRTH